jgi:hypothetical protein
MKNFILYTIIILITLSTKIFAQQTFESKAKEIGDRIEAATTEEKAALKTEIEALNVQVEKGLITNADADKKKQELAQIRASNIEKRVAVEQENLKNLIQLKVDGKIASSNKHYFGIDWSSQSDSIKKSKGEARTTTQFVLGIGLNNVITDGDLENSDFKFAGSRFYEWGFTYNTRIAEKSNLLHLKYGASLMYNDLRPTRNRVFVINGNQTSLQDSPIDLKSSRFRNVYLVAPLHLEFDFSKKTEKDGKTIFNTHDNFRFGLGGYAGIRIKTKQKTEYKVDDIDYDVKAKGDFNTSNFIYGLSGYIGYKETSLYIKYDLNPLFKDNAIKQNNVSLGLRFDLN